MRLNPLASSIYRDPTRADKRNGKVRPKIQNHLRTLRLERGLTIQAVSDGTGLSFSTLHALEKQERRVTLVTAFKLAHFYGLPVERIWQPLFQQSLYK